jgi:patatin-related protein
MIASRRWSAVPVVVLCLVASWTTVGCRSTVAPARSVGTDSRPCLSEGSAQVAADAQGSAQELRLGLVFFGGVSLAIYMHGQTKELQALVEASRAHEAYRAAGGAEGGAAPPRLDGSSQAYFDALEEISPPGVATRVLIDSIAGTSAGGINGIYLAKALAHDQAQDGLTRLWMDNGDIWRLLGGRGKAGGVARLPWRLTRLVTGGEPPLDGDAMLVWAYQALEEMGPVCPGASLVPPSEALTLHVTTTDFHGRPQSYAIGQPPVGRERDYASVLDLTFDRAADGSFASDPFDPRDDPFLAFAVRATSSFPGAFPPIHLDDMAEHLPGVSDEEVARLAALYFDAYRREGVDAEGSWFVDGGVLDNQPFGLVIDDLRTRAPSREVERRLLYLQPDPPPTLTDEVVAQTAGEPSYTGTLWGALSSIARAEPVAGDFAEIADFNTRVRFIDGIIDRVREELSGDAEAMSVFGAGSSFTSGSREAKDEQVRRIAQSAAGALGYDAYVQVRAQAVVEQLGRGAARSCPISDVRRAVLAETVREWAVGRRLIGPNPDHYLQLLVLEQLDPGYLWRRLRFVSDSIDSLYDEENVDRAARAELDRAQAALAVYIEQAANLMQPDELPDAIQLQVGELCRLAAGLSLDSPVGTTAARLSLSETERLETIYDGLLTHIGSRQSEIRGQLERDYEEITATWPAERRRRIHLDYLGFPIWDVVVYPYQRLGSAGEFSPIEVVRLSPNDTRALGAATARDKLGGTRVAHFGAFFQRERREKDYLWGRLDGAERLMAVLYALRGEKDEATEPVVEPPTDRLAQAFEGIFTQEETAGLIPLAQPCMDQVREQMASLPLEAVPEACRAE